LATFNGYKVNSGVKWSVTKDTCIVKMFPKKQSGVKKYGYKAVKKSWKNYCPYCKKKGVLEGFGHGKGEFGVEGGLRCKKCDADWCGVTGQDTGTRKNMKNLTPAPTTSNAKTKSTQNSDLQEKLTSANEGFANNRNPIKSEGSLSLSPLYDINPCDYVKLTYPLAKAHEELVSGDGGLVKFVSSATISAKGISISVTDDVPMPDNYQDESSSDTSSTSNNTSTNSMLNGKNLGKYQKKTRLKGAELKTFPKIFKYFRDEDQGGNGGFDYNFYMNHKKGGDIYQFNESSAKYNWTNKLYNCVDCSWLIYEACLGAGIKGVNIIHGSALFSSGKTIGHFWITYNGKRYDGTSKTARNYVKKKTVVSSSSVLK